MAQAAHIPVHLGSMPHAVEAALARGPLAPGDTLMLNDPFAGGTHLPDITLVTPVFLARRARRRLRGREPRSPRRRRGCGAGLDAARGRDLRGGVPHPAGVARAPRARASPTCSTCCSPTFAPPDERRADLTAQLGAQATGVRRLEALARANGARALSEAAAALIRHAERAVRERLRALPRGTFRFEDALDDDGRGGGPVAIQVALTLDGRRVVADFTGSSPQARGPVNAVAAVTRAATAYAVRCVLGGDFPINHGAFLPIEIVAPPGSVVNPLPPAAVSAGNVETSQRIVDVVLGALARALPDRVPAASYGTMSNLLIGGVDSATGRASRTTRPSPAVTAPDLRRTAPRRCRRT